MSRHKIMVALLIAALTTTSAQADSRIDQVQLTCSDTMSIEGTSALSLRCTGDFSLSGQNTLGTITADESLSIWASGRLTLESVLLTSPAITLTSETQVWLDNATQLNGSTIALHGDVREVGAGFASAIGSSVSLTPGTPSPVPEPNGIVLGLTALMLAGIKRLAESRQR